MLKRTAALLSFALLLSACWQSDQQLVLPGQAANPAVAGTYAYTASDGSNQSVTIRAERDSYYDYTASGAEGVTAHSQLRFARLKADWYLVQSSR